MTSLERNDNFKRNINPLIIFTTSINDIHQDHIRTLSESETIEYYLDNGLLLNDYYSGSMNTSNCTKGVLGYFNNEKKDERELLFELKMPKSHLLLADKSQGT